MPLTRFDLMSSAPGTATPVASDSFSTVSSGVLLVGRPRSVMSR
ncbi:hypothetical protein [Nocardioides panacis]|nr:hypothetical protein [Nocardioides panacis]